MQWPSITRRTRALLAAGTASMLVLAGCGGGDKSSNKSASPAKSSGAAPAAAASPAPSDPSMPAHEPSDSSAATPAAPNPTALPTTPASGAEAGASGAKAPVAKPGAAPAAAKAAASAPAGSRQPTPAPGDSNTRGAAQAAAVGNQGAPNLSPPGGNGGATDVGVTADNVKFGGILMYGYPLGDPIIRPISRQLQAMFKIVNDTGGIYGRKLSFIDCDDGLPDPARTRACYKKLVDQEKIFAFTHGCSYNEDSWQADLQRDKIPEFASCSFSNVEWENPFSFPIHMDMRQEAAASSGWVLKNKHPKTYGILCLNVADSQAACNVIESYMKDAGVKQVFKRTWKEGEANLSADVLAARTANPDIIFHYQLDAVPFIRWVEESAQQNYWPPMGMTGNHITIEGTGGWVGDYPAKQPGGWTTNTSYLLWGSDYIAWRNKFNSNNKGFAHHLMQGQWAGTNIMIECMRRVGPNLTRTAMMGCFNSQMWETGPGLGQKYMWTPGRRYEPGTINQHEYMYKYVNRKTVAEDDGSGAPLGWVPDPGQFVIDAPAKAPTG